MSGKLEAQLRLIKAIQNAYTWLLVRGYPVPGELAAKVDALKARQLRRDKREPAREEKERLEKRIVALMMRRFRKQRDAAISRLEAQHPERIALAPK